MYDPAVQRPLRQTRTRKPFPESLPRDEKRLLPAAPCCPNCGGSLSYLGEDTAYDIKNQAILDRLKGVPKEQRTARFVCAIAAVLPDGKTLVTRETIEGYIGECPAGENGFGYDPIFYVDEYHCSTAELTEEQKNEISHRGKALRSMKKLLHEYGF